MITKIYKTGVYTLFSVMLAFMLTCVVASAEVFTVDMHGNYAHPYSGEIEDSGGESSAALGQSMVDKMVTQEGLLETAGGQQFLSFGFSLMNSISDVTFLTQNKGETSWSNAAHSVTLKEDDFSVFCVPIPAEDAVIKAQCFVEPMGRAVVFYINLDNKTQGNSTNFPATKQDTSSEATPETTQPQNTPPREEVQAPTQSQPESILEEASGIVVGKKEDENPTEQSVVETALIPGDNEYVFDDSFWATLFILFVCANLISGLILMTVFFTIKSLIRKRNITRDTVSGLNFDLDTGNSETDDFVDLNDIGLWGDDDEDDN